MSYAGPVRTRSAIRSTPSRKAASRSVDETDWHQLAIFGAGLALGVAVGAGVALLTAPQTGADTRALLGQKARRTSQAVGRRSHDAWLDVKDELRGMRRALRRKKARSALERDLERESASGRP